MDPIKSIPNKNWATLKSKSVLDQINGFYMFLPNQWFVPNLCIVDFCQPKKSTLPKPNSLPHENRPLLPQKEAGLIFQPFIFRGKLAV